MGEFKIYSYLLHWSIHRCTGASTDPTDEHDIYWLTNPPLYHDLIHYVLPKVEGRGWQEEPLNVVVSEQDFSPRTLSYIVLCNILKRPLQVRFASTAKHMYSILLSTIFFKACNSLLPIRKRLNFWRKSPFPPKLRTRFRRNREEFFHLAPLFNSEMSQVKYTDWNWFYHPSKASLVSNRPSWKWIKLMLT